MFLAILSSAQKQAFSAEQPTPYKSTICNTDEAKKSAKLWDYRPVDAYKFSLKIQKHIENRDLQSLFGLVKGELTYGPRKKVIQGKSFSEVFTNEWREEVLSEKPNCEPVGWRNRSLDRGRR